MLDRIGRGRLQPLLVAHAAEVVASDPPRVRVGRLDASPVAVPLEQPQGLPGEGLRDLLGVLGRLSAQARELAGERMFA